MILFGLNIAKYVYVCIYSIMTYFLYYKFLKINWLLVLLIIRIINLYK